jgi:PPOX class probable F420-dependent enzyme
MQIPDSTRDLFERPLLCSFTTINPNGQPHTVPVWVDYDGTYVRVNSPAQARKARNLKEGSKVAVLVLDPQNGGHWIEVQGHVAEIRDEANGAREHINALSQKYTGNPVYKSWNGGSEVRLMFVIEPDKVNGR